MRVSKNWRHGGAVIGAGLRRMIAGLAAGLAAAAVAGIGRAALAQGRTTDGMVAVTPTDIGAPVPWGISFQGTAGPVKGAITEFNILVFWIIVAITIFVMILLGWVMWRYRAARNPTPSKTSHNTVLEIAWTVVPVLILVIIAIPSFRLIYYEDRVREADLTVNVQGRQWYWNYAYPEHGNLTFDSYPIPDDQIRPGQLRSLSVDNPLVVPVGKNVRVITVGQDVIHSFFVPSLGVQKYTIPGRTLETWFRADRAGVYYGQCNQICGTNHWFMPIEVRAVPEPEFQAWVAQARARAAEGRPPGPPGGRAVATGAETTTPEQQQTAEARR